MMSEMMSEMMTKRIYFISIHTMPIVELILALVTLPLLFVITLVNTENIFQNNISQIYVLIYGIYFLLSTI